MLKMHQLLYISEQHQRKHLATLPDDFKSVLVKASYTKLFPYKADLLCFGVYNDEQTFTVDSNYFIGVDWIVRQKAAIYVEPKLNDGTEEVDFLGMLLKSLEAPENLEHLEGLFHVDYDQPWITIPSQKDLLSPILVVQFLKLTQKIVRKGLKKSYYRITENLNSRVKGKILVGQQIKENIVKNRLTKTICNYQEYGINTYENQFLKLVLEFVGSWLNSKRHFFDKPQYSQLLSLLQYCSPAFEQVDILANKHQKIHNSANPFYKEYIEALKIGGYILKRFSFNITKTSTDQAETPPFWIDMSKLFELYVFQKLKDIFNSNGDVTYHDSFRKKETDILIRATGYECVVDCKYKPQYKDNTPSLEDKRQLAGYTRLKSVYRELAMPLDKVIKGVLIYSHQSSPDKIQRNNLFETDMGEYVDFYKLGICLPVLN